MRRVAGPVFRFLGAGFFCVHPLGALVALGWTCALMRHAAHERWRRLGASTAEELRPRIGFARTFFVLAWRGLQAGVATWVSTLPAAVLAYFAWYAGWNNSFNKGYEQAWVAPSLGVLAALLFAVAMLYVPIAQARQAVTEDWRAFFGFRAVWALIGEKWLSTLALAAAHAAAALPVLLSRALPNFLPMLDHDLERLDAARAQGFLGAYNLLFAPILFCLFVALRLASARIYASGLDGLARRGATDAIELHPSERNALSAYGLGTSSAPSRRLDPGWAAWAATGAGRLVSAAGAAACWLVFAATVLLAQFLNYQAGRVWLNHPLVHVPWTAVAGSPAPAER